jgi:hypothetical protein
MGRNSVLSIVLALGGTSGVSAQLVDATLGPADRFQGTISDAGDIDVVELPALDGESLRLSVKAGKGSGLRPRVELFAPGSGKPFASSDAKKKKAALKKTALDETGTWEVHVSGLDDSTGSYELRLRVVAGKTLKKPTVTPGVPVVFFARDGAQLSARIRPAKGSDALPAVPQLDGPVDPVDLDPFAKTAKSGKSVAVKKAVLPDFGSYTFTPLAVDPGVAELLVKLRIRPPKPTKTIVVEGSGGAPWAIAFDPSVASMPATDETDFPFFGIVVPLKNAVALPTSMDWSVVVDEAQTASGTVDVEPDGTWSTNVPLSAGDNTLLVDAGNDTSRSLDVTYNPGYAFGGSLELSPDVVEGPLSETVTARILITDEDTDPASVSLVRDEDPEQPPQFVAQLYDDGTHGDEQADDGIYTGTFVPAADEGNHHYRVMLGTVFAVSATSEAARLLVLPMIDLGVIAARQDAQGVMGDQLEAAQSAGTFDETLDTLLAQLEADPDVADAGKGTSGHGLWVLYADGMPSIVHVPGPGTKSGAPVGLAAVANAGAAVGGPRAAPAAGPGAGAGNPPGVPPRGGGRRAEPGPRRVMASQLAESSSYAGAPRPRASWSRAPTPSFGASVDGPGTGSGGGTPGPLALSADNAVGTEEALLLAPYVWQFAGNEELDDVIELLTNDVGFTVTYKPSPAAGQGQISNFTDWSDYGVIGVSTHGDTYFVESVFADGEEHLNEVFGGSGGVVLLDTGEETDDMQPWLDDLFAGRLVTNDDKVYVTPAFLAAHAGALPNSLVYLSSCRSTYNASMVSTLLELGAGSVLGYSEYVCASFSNTTGIAFFESLVEDDEATVQSAYQPEVDPQGCGSQSGSPPAVFQGFGNQKLSLFRGEDVLIDPSFELPLASSPWGFDGAPNAPCPQPINSCSIAGLTGAWGEFLPTDGAQMAFIQHSFPGPPSEFEGFLWRESSAYLFAEEIELPATVDRLSFDWNYIWYCEPPPFNVDETPHGFSFDRVLEPVLWMNGNGPSYTTEAVGNQTPCDFKSSIVVSDGEESVHATGWHTTTLNWGLLEDLDEYDEAWVLGLLDFSIESKIYMEGDTVVPVDCVVLIDNFRFQ